MLQSLPALCFDGESIRLNFPTLLAAHLRVYKNISDECLMPLRLENCRSERKQLNELNHRRKDGGSFFIRVMEDRTNGSGERIKERITCAAEKIFILVSIDWLRPIAIKLICHLIASPQ